MDEWYSVEEGRVSWRLRRVRDTQMHPPMAEERGLEPRVEDTNDRRQRRGSWDEFNR